MPAATTPSQQSNPFIKQLTSSNRKTRDAAIESLRTYLQRPTSFSELEFMKLWKGLFFCMWMADKPLTQQRLARDLADLMHVVQRKDSFLHFVRAFWKTIARGWAGIDALRMDKFLYLVRCYVNQGFERMSRQQWSDTALLDEYLETLELVPLNAQDAKVPNGLRYHVIDIYVDELDKVDTKRNAPVEKILEPLRRLGQDSINKVVRERVREALKDERLQDWKAVRQAKEQENGADSVEKRVSTGAISNDRLVRDGEDDDAEFEGFGD